MAHDFTKPVPCDLVTSRTVIAEEQRIVLSMDAASHGGAPHVYEVQACHPDTRREEHVLGRIVFQTGPVQEAGVNGVTETNLLEIVLDRLREFQAGAYHSRENALAITKIEEALHWLEARTRNRQKRGVEGTSAA